MINNTLHIFLYLIIAKLHIQKDLHLFAAHGQWWLRGEILLVSIFGYYCGFCAYVRGRGNDNFNYKLKQDKNKKYVCICVNNQDGVFIWMLGLDLCCYYHHLYMRKQRTGWNILVCIASSVDGLLNYDIKFNRIRSITTRRVLNEIIRFFYEKFSVIYRYYESFHFGNRKSPKDGAIFHLKMCKIKAHSINFLITSLDVYC